jgi:hypothetical protein
MEVLAKCPNSFRALVVSATLRGISPVRGGQKLNSDSDAVILLIVLDSSRMLISVPDAMLNALLLTFFSSAATVASITSETK